MRLQVSRKPIISAVCLVFMLAGASAQTIVRSFDGAKGVKLEDCTPEMRCGRQPEPNVAANGKQVVQVTWQEVDVYDYSGKLLRSTPMDKFVSDAGMNPIAQARNPQPNATPKGSYEPHVVWDEFIGRWIVAVTCHDDCMIVSSSADATASWKGTAVTCLQGGPCLGLDPAMHIGYDKNGVYYCGGHLGDTNRAALPKVSYDCFAIPQTEVKAIADGKEPQHINRQHNLPLDILPAVDNNPNKSPTAPALFAAKTCDGATGCQKSKNYEFTWMINTFTWNGPTGTWDAEGQLVKTDVGSKQNKWLYNSPCCTDLMGEPQKGSDIILRAAESHRLINLVQNGSHIYGALGTGPCTQDCGAQGTDTNNLMIYVDFDCSKPAACVVSQTAKLSGPDVNPMFGTLGVDKNGNIGILAISSTASTDLSLVMWSRKKNDPPNTFQGPTTVLAGTEPYNCPGANAPTLSLMANAVGILTLQDPLDGTKLWTTQQYGGDSARCAWRTRIVEYEMSGKAAAKRGK